MTALTKKVTMAMAMLTCDMFLPYALVHWRRAHPDVNMLDYGVRHTQPSTT